MIQVENLKKHYAATQAVDDVSFHVDEHEVLGFLGPNGAGKTTTLRVLTGYLAATLLGEGNSFGEKIIPGEEETIFVPADDTARIEATNRL